MNINEQLKIVVVDVVEFFVSDVDREYKEVL